MLQLSLWIYDQFHFPHVKKLRVTVNRLNFRKVKLSFKLHTVEYRHLLFRLCGYRGNQTPKVGQLRALIYTWTDSFCFCNNSSSLRHRKTKEIRCGERKERCSKEREKMASHDLRQEDGRSRVHSEVSVYSGEPPSPSPAVLSVLSACVLSVSSKYVSIKAPHIFSYQFQ